MPDDEDLNAMRLAEQRVKAQMRAEHGIVEVPTEEAKGPWEWLEVMRRLDGIERGMKVIQEQLALLWAGPVELPVLKSGGTPADCDVRWEEGHWWIRSAAGSSTWVNVTPNPPLAGNVVDFFMQPDGGAVAITTGGEIYVCRDLLRDTPELEWLPFSGALR